MNDDIRLDKNQRDEIIKDIQSVYSYKYSKDKLEEMSNKQLYAFREDLRRRGKLDKYLSGQHSIALSMFLNKYGGDRYIIDGTEWIRQELFTTVTIGVNMSDKVTEIGKIILDQNWKIVEVVIHGETIERYNGLELIIDGKK